MYSRVSALIVVILAAILSSTIQVVTAAQQTAVNKNGFSLYLNSQYRFKIQYPSDWVVNSEPGNISLFSFDSPINKPGQLIQDAELMITTLQQKATRVTLNITQNRLLYP